MYKRITLLLFVSLGVYTALSGDCNNPLLAKLGLTGLATPTTVTGINFCKSLKTKQSCCSADTINSIQTKVDEFVARIKEMVKAKDRALDDARKNTMPQLQTNMNRLKESSNTAKTKIREKQQQAGQTAEAQQTETDSLTIATNMATMAEKLGERLPDMKTNFGTYQRERINCVVEMAKLQGAAYCLACDPDYATMVGSDATVGLSANVCTRLRGSCFSFFNLAGDQNDILDMKRMVPMIDTLKTAMDKAGAPETISAGMTEIISANTQGKARKARTDAEAPITKPSNCDATRCDFICNELFLKGVVQEKNVGNGGKFDPTLSEQSTPSARLLRGEEGVEVAEEKVSEGRILTTSWDFESDEAGVTATFVADPAGVNSGSSLVMSVMVCISALIMTLFI